ncbi:MFS general substrate transporter [Mycena indigotica]|uniref:MFS general substrate transporter n=1 Tax=Mycena indigotica TaxID=2126181 RepID=A0A8H6SRX3_9AGAR|nr:MFS general substrate transporter [Mycena indigotica]KAF7303596.1 MFS general substrate transporter [Mycena indigotica]
MSKTSYAYEKSNAEKRPAMDVFAIPPPPAFPDGGFQAWGTVFGSFLIMFCGFGYSSSFGVYQDFYVRDYLSHSSPSAISWIGSVNIFIILAGGFITGRLHDRGHFYPLIYVGSFLVALSLFMLSLAQPNQLYQILLAQGIANGVGAGMTYIPCIAVVSQHFSPKRRALAMTIIASGSSLGAVVHPIMLNNLLPRLGFGNTVRASAGLVSGLLTIACCLVRTRLPPPKTSINVRSLLLKIVKDGPYLAATLGLAIYTIGFYYPLFYLQLDAIQHGLDPTFAFYSLVIMNTSSFVGRLAPGFVAHRFAVQRMITVFAACGAVLILCMIALQDEASVIVIGILYGFFAGCIVTCMSPLLAVLTEDMSELGARLGISVAISGIGILVGPPIDGVLLTEQFIWWRPALFSGLMAMAGFALFVVMLTLPSPKKAHARANTKITGKEVMVVNIELAVVDDHEDMDRCEDV